MFISSICADRETGKVTEASKVYRRKILIIKIKKFGGLKQMKMKNRKFLKSIVSFGLAFSILSANIPVSQVFAQSTQSEQFIQSENSKRTNFNFISVEDLANIEYTYEENGITYKVIESSNLELSKVNTRIYEQVNNQYILISSYETEIIINDSNIELIKIEDGNNNIEVISLGEINKVYDGNVSELFEKIERGERSGKVTESYWLLHSSFDGSSKIKERTYSVVVILITGILALKFPSASPVLSGVTYLALDIIDEAIEDVYYTKKWYYKWPMRDGQRLTPAFAERADAFFYTDNSRRTLIGSASSEVYDESLKWWN